MRFMVMHKVDAHMEAGGGPIPHIVQSMGALVQQSLKDGTFTTGAGLHRSARRARLETSGGSVRVTHGPYSGKNELVSSFAMIRAGSLEEAIERARELSRVLGDAEVEVGPVVEPWDIGVMPKPDGATNTRFLLLCKGDRSTETSVELPPERRAALDRLLGALRAEGVLLLADRLAPSASGARLAKGPDGKRTWTDGPFAESKELIAGFSILQLPTRADAIAWAERYAAILTENEVDVRELVP
jgi:hypothetical protein